MDQGSVGFTSRNYVAMFASCEHALGLLVHQTMHNKNKELKYRHLILFIIVHSPFLLQNPPQYRDKTNYKMIMTFFVTSMLLFLTEPSLHIFQADF
jgi:hypothetical protein